MKNKSTQIIGRPFGGNEGTKPRHITHKKISLTSHFGSEGYVFLIFLKIIILHIRSLCRYTPQLFDRYEKKKTKFYSKFFSTLLIYLYSSPNKVICRLSLFLENKCPWKQILAYCSSNITQSKFLCSSLYQRLVYQKKNPARLKLIPQVVLKMVFCYFELKILLLWKIQKSYVTFFIISK